MKLFGNFFENKKNKIEKEPKRTDLAYIIHTAGSYLREIEDDKEDPEIVLDITLKEIGNQTEVSNEKVLEGNIVNVRNGDAANTTYQIERVHNIIFNEQEYSFDSLNNLEEMVKNIDEELKNIKDRLKEIFGDNKFIYERTELLLKESQYKELLLMTTHKLEKMLIEKRNK